MKFSTLLCYDARENAIENGTDWHHASILSIYWDQPLIWSHFKIETYKLSKQAPSYVKYYAVVNKSVPTGMLSKAGSFFSTTSFIKK